VIIHEPKGSYLLLQDLTQTLSKISDMYSKRFSIERSPDWYLIKIQEELGELSSAYLKLSGRARTGNLRTEEIKKNLEDEIADVLAMTLLFAKSQGINPETALRQKWYKHLDAAGVGG
jgi:NTP pyrophosphatase (non-canonical NTP hydrolase)